MGADHMFCAVLGDAPKIPRDRDDHHSPAAAAARRTFVTQQTGATLDHVGAFSFDSAREARDFALWLDASLHGVRAAAVGKATWAACEWIEAQRPYGLRDYTLSDDDDDRYSITIPSLIVATYGGATGLPTQRECLEMMDCYGSGKVGKFAEIVAATVLCGELSLGSAIVADEWVSSHDTYGRNRP